MLTSLSLKNFRCFSQTKKIEFAALNVFIGPNNAGKSSFLSATELVLRSGGAGSADLRPIDFSAQPEYASFSSVLRKAWSKSERKPIQFAFDAEWSLKDKGRPTVWSRYIFRGNPDDDFTYVNRANYGVVKRGRRSKSIIDITSNSGSRPISYSSPLSKGDKNLFFFKSIPYLRTFQKANLSPDLKRIRDYALQDLDTQQNVFAIRPHRPVPRALYVLDDPGMTAEDRDFISYLVNLWQRDDKTSEATKERIKQGIRTLHLAKYIEIARPVRGASSAVQVRVSTGTKRELVTIADVGFGLSQALPLLARDASLSNDVLIAYQPEVHLHPFAQSRLADIFVQSLTRKNSIFIETHSQYLILRLQYLIATGEVAHKDVKIFCVERENNQSVIRPMIFSSDGKPKTPWPSGFLDTGLDLARSLAKARMI